jgi:LPXTG-motif cell wall-anchored protein
LVSAPNPSVVGDPVTITATVTSGGEPVGDGDVTFTDTSTTPATVLAADVPVDAEGRATATVDTLAVGAHDITASFDGSADYVPSEGTLTHVVVARTSTELTSAPNPSDFGAAVAFTAAVTSGGAPVVEGDVTFVDRTTATTLASGVVLDAQGRATIEIDDLAVGSHLVVASYGGASLLAPSSSDQIVHRVRGIADAGGPYVIGEGDSLTLDASGSQVGDTASYGWDLDGDGSFDDAAGVNPTVAWAELVALGIDDGDGSVRPITLEVTDGGESFTAVTSLTVTNVAATVTFDGPTTATVGVPFTIKVGADDPSTIDMAGTFVYAVDWGDGTAPLTVSGPADPPVTHTYTAAGRYTLSVTVTDPDGATSEPATLTITVSPAGATTTTVATPGAALPRTGSTTSTVAVAGLALVAAGAVTLVASKVPTARQRRGLTGG